MSYKSPHPFKLAQGSATLLNQNMKILRPIAVKNIGRMMRMIDIPALLSAVSSKFSPNFPNVMREESKTDNGSANGKVISEK
jgi:hypothetical protein